MIDFGQIKAFLFTILGFIVMAFLAVFKYRGQKIDSLKNEIDQHELKDKAQDFEKNNVIKKAEAEAIDYEEVSDGKVIL